MAKLYEPLQFELSNGMPVILQHFEGPVAASYWWVRTGSADESSQEAGFAHFLEHMLFKDASAKEVGRPSTGQTASMIESLGGDINAYTSFDHTVYHVTCAAHHWERVLDQFGLMAKPQRFLKADFEREREVILEELRKNEDSPGRQLFQSLFQRTFKKHPYGRPVIGFEKVLRGATLSNLEKFYRTHYVSPNMGLILVGPLSGASLGRRQALLAQAERLFGSKVLPVKSVEAKPRPAEEELRVKADWEVRRFDVKTPSISFSFRVPELDHEDMPALDLLAGILGMGELSRMYQRLFYELAMVTDVGAGIYVPKEPGMLYFQAEFQDLQNAQGIVQEMCLQMKRLMDEGPLAEEMERVLTNAESEKLYATQTADGLAGRLGFLRFVVGDLDYDAAYLARLRQVTPADVQEVAARYLDHRRMSGVLMLPKNAPEMNAERFEEIAGEILSSRKPVPKKAKVPAKSSSIEGTETILFPSGLELRVVQRPHSHVFSIHAAVLGGLRLELAQPQLSDWGASHLLAQTWTKGTHHRDGKKIASLIEGRAASFDGFSGRNSIGLQMTGLARNWDELSGLFSEVLFEPSFPDDEIDHARRVTEDSIRSIEDHSSQLCSKLFLETLYERHPYGKLSYGSLESIHAISPQRIKSLHKAWVTPSRLVLSVSGPIKTAWAEKLVERIHQAAELQSSGKELAEAASIASSLPLSNEAALKAPRWVERILGREQVHILIGGLGTKINSDDRFAIRILQTLLGGQSGRLFIELREKKSLAYTVSPTNFEGIERGYPGTYIACAPSKRSEAEKGVSKVLEALAQKGPSVAEMSRAKEFFLGRRAMDLQSDPALASHVGMEALYGIKAVKEADFVKKIRSISGGEVRSVCQKYLVQPHQVTSVVG